MKKIYIEKQTNHFMEEAEKIHKEHDKDTINSYSTIYHYTDYHALEGILKKKNLWFTDYRCLNDPLEIEFSSTLIKNEIHAHINSISDSLILKDFFIESLNLYNRIVPINMNIYICSFCKNPDYLPAWRWYGDNGAGFSIGFRVKIDEPDKIFRETLTKIIYGEEESKKMIKRFLILANQYWQKIYPHCTYIKDKATLNEYLSCRLVSNLITLLPCIKHEDYSVEEETRLFYQIINYNGAAITGFIPNEKLFKRLRKISSSPFVKPESGEIGTLIHDFDIEQLIEIRVGPRCNAKEATQEIKTMLDENGFDSEKIKINKSEVFYRG